MIQILILFVDDLVTEFIFFYNISNLNPLVPVTNLRFSMHSLHTYSMCSEILQNLIQNSNTYPNVWLKENLFPSLCTKRVTK